MTWQKPSDKICPTCGNMLLEKGNKLVCADAGCGYMEEKPSSTEEKKTSSTVEKPSLTEGEPSSAKEKQTVNT